MGQGRRIAVERAQGRPLPHIVSNVSRDDTAVQHIAICS